MNCVQKNVPSSLYDTSGSAGYGSLLPLLFMYEAEVHVWCMVWCGVLCCVVLCCLIVEAGLYKMILLTGSK